MRLKKLEDTNYTHTKKKKEEKKKTYAERVQEEEEKKEANIKKFKAT